MKHSAEMWLFVQLWLTPFLAVKCALMWQRQSEKNFAVIFSLCLVLVNHCRILPCMSPQSPHPHSQRPWEVSHVLESLNHPHSIPTTTQKHSNQNSTEARPEFTQRHSSLKKRMPPSYKSQVCHCRGSRHSPGRVPGFMLSLILMMQCFINWSFPEQHVQYQ